MKTQIFDGNTDREQQLKAEFEHFLNLWEVRRVLGLSYKRITELIRAGDLPAYNASGEPLKRSEVQENTKGLRVLPSDLKNYLDSIRL